MLRGTSHPPKSFEFRRSSVAISLLALVLQLSSAGHLWLVEHVQCAEHGDLVHGEGHHDDTARAPLIAGRHVQPVDDSSATADHEHCLAAVERRDAALLSAATEASVALKIASVKPELRARTVARSDRAKFRVAPKNSPPA